MTDKNRVNWFVCVGSKSFGPYSKEIIFRLLKEQKISYDNYLWTQGLSNWQKARYLEPFASFTIKPESPERIDLGEKLSLELEKEYQSKPWLKKVSDALSSRTVGYSIKSLSDWTGVPLKDLFTIGEQAIELYNPFPIQGKRKKRWIEAPDEKLKAVQRLILDNLLKDFPISGAAHGFVPSRSILTHASNHRRKRWVVSLDIRSFFPSVNEDMVREIAQELPIPHHEIELFVQLTTRNDHLPQGAPTSPAIGNLVLKELDEKLCEEVRGTGWFYSRYADDLTFSGFKNPKRILQVAKRHIKEAGFFVSEEKCRIRGKDQRQMVTGIVVNDRLALSKEKRNLVRAMKHRLANGLVPAEEMHHVMGWINFSNYVELCNETMPRRGPSVRPRRLSLNQWFECKKNAMKSLEKWKNRSWTYLQFSSELAKSTGISMSSLRRFDNEEYSSKLIRNATISELKKLDLFTSFDCYGCIMHDLAEKGRLFDLELDGCLVSDLFRIRLGEKEAETVLSLSIASKDKQINWNHPFLKDKESLTRNSENIEKIANLVLKEKEELALDLTMGLKEVDVFNALLSNYGDEKPHPRWLFSPYAGLDRRSFFYNLLAVVGKRVEIELESPLKQFSALDFSDDEFIQNLDFLWGCNQLTQLNLTNCKNLEDITGLGECPNLTTLTLDGCEKIKDFSQISKLSFLKELSIRNETGKIGSVDGAEACKQAWASLYPEEEFDEYQFEYTGTVASGQRYLLFSDQKFTISNEQFRELEENVEICYDQDWFSPIKKLLEGTTSKWGPSLCVKVNNRWVVMGFYSW